MTPAGTTMTMTMTNNRPRRLPPGLFLLLGIAILLGGVALIALQAERPDVPRHVSWARPTRAWCMPMSRSGWGSERGRGLRRGPTVGRVVVPSRPQAGD